MPRIKINGKVAEVSAITAHSMIAGGHAEPVTHLPADEVGEMRADELRAYAAEQGVDLTVASTKAEIRAALDEAGVVAEGDADESGDPDAA